MVFGSREKRGKGKERKRGGSKRRIEKAEMNEGRGRDRWDGDQEGCKEEEGGAFLYFLILLFYKLTSANISSNILFVT